MLKIITTIVLLAALVFFVSRLQRNMLYSPSAELPSQASLSAENLTFWPASTDYRGIVNTFPAKTTKGTIVVFHGNAGTAADRSYYVSSLAPLGFRVVLAEYPGYGGRRGKPGEETFVRDAKETLRLVSETFGGPLYVLGESLGCGVAAAAAKESLVRIDGMILITPWDTLLSVAGEKLPWLPVRLLMRDTYDTVGNLRGYRGRVAVVGAARDEVIPVGHAESLFRSLAEGPQPRKMYVIRGAGHNDWPGMVDAVWWKEITAFIQG
jgi:pimeloyl-ACP methyl ester carboxylesterase